MTCRSRPRRTRTSGPQTPAIASAWRGTGCGTSSCLEREAGRGSSGKPARGPRRWGARRLHSQAAGRVRPADLPHPGLSRGPEEAAAGPRWGAGGAGLRSMGRRVPARPVAESQPRPLCRPLAWPGLRPGEWPLWGGPCGAGRARSPPPAALPGGCRQGSAATRGGGTAPTGAQREGRGLWGSSWAPSTWSTGASRRCSWSRTENQETR